MNWLASISSSRPKTVLLVIFFITLILCAGPAAKFAVVLNPENAISRDLGSLRYYSLVKKKFSLNDSIIIGIENASEGAYSVSTLRYAERLTDRLKRLATYKNHLNAITGDLENRKVPCGIEARGIQSIVNARDATRDYAGGRAATLIGLAREQGGTAPAGTRLRDRLPASDDELARMLPALEKTVTASSIDGIAVSPDKKSCSVIVPLASRVDYKLRIIKQELPCMLDAERMMNRFLGRDGYFPFSIYNKTIGGITVNDAYVRGFIARNKTNTKNYFINLFARVKSHYGSIYDILTNGEADRSCAAALKLIESDGLYELEDGGMIYEDTINDLYAFVIMNMDPISKNRLESTVYGLSEIYDTGNLYHAILKLVGKNRPAAIRTVIAGAPIDEYIVKDAAGRELPIIIASAAAAIIFVHLVCGTRLWGSLIPAAVGAVSGLWICGGMVMAGVALSFWTAPVLFIITAAGSLPVTLFVSRYREIISPQDDPVRNEAIAEAMKRTARTIAFTLPAAGAPFLALLPSPVRDVSLLAASSAAGLAVATLLTATGVPALLSLLPIPARRSGSGPQRLAAALADRAGNWGTRNSRMVTVISAIIVAAGIYGLVLIRAESGISSHLRPGGSALAAAEFINERFPGSTPLNIVFTLKDSLDLATRPIRKILARRIDAFVAAYRSFLAMHPDLQRAEQLNRFFTDDLSRLKRNPQKNQKALEKRLAIFTDMLNEHYVLRHATDGTEIINQAAAEKEEEFGGIPDLSDFTGFEAVETPKTPVEEGIASIMKRIGSIKTNNDRIAGREHIMAIRQYKNQAAADELLRSYINLTDLLKMDITQPLFLRKVDALTETIRGVNGPVAIRAREPASPIGPVRSVTDYIKRVYQRLYHAGNTAFYKIPDMKTDRLPGAQLTDRAMTGASLGWVRSIWPDVFHAFISRDLKMLRSVAFLRDDRADTVSGAASFIQNRAGRLFPDLDPYVQKVKVTGLPMVHREMNGRLTAQLARWAAISGAAALICCFLIMRSLSLGMLITIPLILPAAATLGAMGWAGIPITCGTAPVAGLALVSQAYFIMHRMERMHAGEGPSNADSGDAAAAGAGNNIVIPGLALLSGLIVLGFSSSKIAGASVLMGAVIMSLNIVAAVTVAPAVLRLAGPGSGAKNLQRM